MGFVLVALERVERGAAAGAGDKGETMSFLGKRERKKRERGRRGGEEESRSSPFDVPLFFVPPPPRP